MWDKPSEVEGRVDELPTEIDEEEDLIYTENRPSQEPQELPDDNDLAFSDEFYNRFCDVKIKE